MKKGIPIIIAFDNNYAPLGAVTMYSVAQNTESPVDFYILEKEVSDKNKRKICKNLQKFSNVSINFIDMTKFDYLAFKEMKTFSLSAYSRYFIPEILPDEDKVIYLDSDIIVCGDIKELYEQDLDNYPLGVVIEDYTKHYIEHIKIIFPQHEGNVFNSGVLLMDIQKLISGGYVQKLLDTNKKYSDMLEWPDQDVFNIVFNDNFKVLDYKYNPLEGCFSALREAFPDKADEIEKNPYLIHYNGPKKPWETPKTNMTKHFWRVVKKTAFRKNICKKYNAKDDREIYYLFGFIPIMKTIQRPKNFYYKMFGLTLLKVRSMI